MPKKPKITRSVGFYLVEGFWADTKPDYSKFGSQYWLTPEFSKLMEEPVVSLKDSKREVIVYRDGLISYREPELQKPADLAMGGSFQRIEKYSEIINALVIVFTSTVTSKLKVKHHTNFEITHHDMFGMMFENGKFTGMGIPQKSATANQIDKRFLSNAPANRIDALDLWIDSPRRAIIGKAIIEEAIKLFFKLTKNRDNIRLLARANKAAAEYAGTAFSDCILIAWLPVEIHLYEQLKEYMDSKGSARFNRKRKDNLLKDYTVSEVIELLEFSKQINKAEYDSLTKIRKIRNDIIHNGYAATFEEAGAALSLLESIIKSKTGHTLALNTGISMNLF